MNMPVKLAIFGAAMAFSVTPALAAGPPSGGNPNNGTSHKSTNAGSQGSHGSSHKPSKHVTSHTSSTPGPNASPPAKAQAYGRFCQHESKTHKAGTPGTPFSQCVTAMAKLANGSSKNPRAACKGESRTHTAGTPGTPFSICVTGGKNLLRHQHRGHKVA